MLGLKDLEILRTLSFLLTVPFFSIARILDLRQKDITDRFLLWFIENSEKNVQLTGWLLLVVFMFLLVGATFTTRHWC